MLTSECGCSGFYSEFFCRVQFPDLQNQFEEGRTQPNDFLVNFTPFNYIMYFNKFVLERISRIFHNYQNIYEH